MTKVQTMTAVMQLIELCIYPACEKLRSGLRHYTPHSPRYDLWIEEKNNESDIYSK